MLKPYRKHLCLALVLLLGLWLLTQAYSFYRIKFPNRSHAMIAELQDMQTYCIGRYQIDLPRGTTIIRASMTREGIDIYEEGTLSEENYQHNLEQRWEELQRLTINENSRPRQPYIEPSQRIEQTPRGTLFTFKHRKRYLDEWPGGSKGWKFFYETEGHLLLDERFFLFKAGSEREKTAQVMQQLQLKPEGVAPTEPGFCGVRAFFAGEVPSLGEGLFLAFRLPGSQAGLRIKYPTTGPLHGPIDIYNSDEFKAHLLRDTSFSVNDMTGRELIVSTSEKKYKEVSNDIRADWFFPGPIPGYANSGVHIFMEYGNTTAKSPPTFGRLPPLADEQALDEEKFLALWDGILKTFKPRPGAL